MQSRLIAADGLKKTSNKKEKYHDDKTTLYSEVEKNIRQTYA